MEALIQSLCLSIGVLGMSDPQEKRACQYIPTIVKESNRHNIDPTIFIALIYAESCFNPWEVSYANACGLTQVIPKWTGGKASGRKKYTCKQLKNPYASIKVGSRILAWWIKYAKGNVRNALCGYNAGFKKCFNKDSRLNKSSYSNKVIRVARKIRREIKKIKKNAL
jgi:soluble lytic murein transglycosylase-like protein